MKTIVFKIIALIAVVSICASPASAQTIPEGDPPEAPEPEFQFTPISSEEITIETISKSETGLYIVRLKDPALASYTGGIPGLAPTAPEKTGAAKLDVNAPESLAYTNYLDIQQGRLIELKLP